VSAARWRVCVGCDATFPPPPYCSLIFNQSINYAPFGQRELRLLFVFGYATLIAIQVLTGLAGKINQMGTVYFVVSLVYAIIMFFSLMLGIWLVWSTEITLFVGLAFVCSLLCYVLAACMHGTFLRSIVMFPQYLLLLPAFVNLFPIYSFCNMHDISWGTKEGNLQSETRRMHEGRAERALKKAQKAQLALEKLRKEEQQRKIDTIRAAQRAALGLPPAGSEGSAAAGAASGERGCRMSAATSCDLLRHLHTIRPPPSPVPRRQRRRPRLEMRARRRAPRRAGRLQVLASGPFPPPPPVVPLPLSHAGHPSCPSGRARVAHAPA